MDVIVADAFHEAVLGTSAEDLAQLGLDVQGLASAGMSDGEIANRIADAGWSLEFGYWYVAVVKTHGSNIRLVVPQPPIPRVRTKNSPRLFWLAAVLSFFLSQGESRPVFWTLAAVCLTLLIVYGRRLDAVAAWLLFVFGFAFTWFIHVPKWLR